MARFATALAAIAADDARSSVSMLDFYTEPYLDFAKATDKVCLCGALAGEMMALPPALRARVDQFFKEHQAWLAMILQRGEERGEFKLAAPPAKTARLILGALQGALLVETHDAGCLAAARRHRRAQSATRHLTLSRRGEGASEASG